MPIKVREWIGPALASPNLVLDAQPPAQPHGGVVVDRPVRFGDGAHFEVEGTQIYLDLVNFSFSAARKSTTALVAGDSRISMTK